MGKEFKVGTIQRIVLSGQYGVKDYQLPVPYSHANKNKLTVYMCIHKQHPQCERGNLYLPGSDVTNVKFTDIFSHVSLTYESERGLYLLPKDEVLVLQNETKKLLTPTARRSGTGATPQETQQTPCAPDDDTLREVVTPSVGQEDGVRRSRRTRIVQSSIYS